MDDENCEKVEYSEDRLKRESRSTPDWSENSQRGDHLWVPTHISGDFCYVGELCLKSGIKLKCSACNVVVHVNCMRQLVENLRLQCKPSFQIVPLNQYRKQNSVEHHWVRRQSEKTKCRHCTRSFQCKIPFASKDFVAVSCSWCKAAYHNKECCFDTERIEKECTLGIHRGIIVPPNWILKLPNERTNIRQIDDEEQQKEKTTKPNGFFVRAIPTSEIHPLIVFINPRSGGNQGLRLLQKFQWLLNPRQIFDLTQGGPGMGLRMYQKVHNLRVLACGGDGTVGWVLSVIDQIGMSPVPAVGVLPLGTGNDLARALGWGGGYTDEPVSKILSNIKKSQPVLLDRWKVEVEKNPNAAPDEDGNDNLPLNVINNYFSMGVDAHIALEFHEAREAHPKKFNSRLKNKMFYGQLGGKDLLQRKWKDLTDFVTIECDGTDFTPKLREQKVHAIVFLNIPSYGGGTRPWNRSMGISRPSTEDGLIEVIGLTTYQLPLLQAGGHGTCITQCKSAKIVTSKTIPMQVDGEACKVAPSIFTISHLNKATMLASRKSGIPRKAKAAPCSLEINIHYLSMPNYDKYRSDIDLLMKSAARLHTFQIDDTADLSMLRDEINSFLDNSKDERFSNDWYFLDYCGNEQLLKIDREEENLHYVSDIASENLYIVECSNATRPLTPKSEANSDVSKTGKAVEDSEDLNEMDKKMLHSMERPKKVKPLSPVNKKSIQASRAVPCPTFILPISRTRFSVSERLFDFAKGYSDHNDTCDEASIEDFIKRDITEAEIIANQKNYALIRSSAEYSMLQSAALCGHEEKVAYLISSIYSKIHKPGH